MPGMLRCNTTQGPLLSPTPGSFQQAQWPSCPFLMDVYCACAQGCTRLVLPQAHDMRLSQGAAPRLRRLAEPLTQLG